MTLALSATCAADAARQSVGRAHRLLAPMLLLLLASAPTAGAMAQETGVGAAPILGRHLETAREDANNKPRGEGDQAVVEGWPLYRNERAQRAFNAAMATLAATENAAPSAAAFKGCVRLECPIDWPRLTSDGWLPAGRLWVAPNAYVLIAHSARNRSGKYRRHALKRMEHLVFHEFINSSRNVDPYDTISSHDEEVFVPFYMSKTRTDARGRSFVVVVQVAPYDVISVHATNLGSAGPGIEVAKNAGEELEGLQALGGIAVAGMIKGAAPHLDVVNHRGEEGLPMLEAYEGRLKRIARRPSSSSITLPFTPADAIRMTLADERLEQIVLRPGASPPVPVAARGVVPVQSAAVQAEPVLVRPPTLVRRPARL